MSSMSFGLLLLRKWNVVAAATQTRTVKSLVKADKFQVIRRPELFPPPDKRKLPNLPMEPPLWPDQQVLGKKMKGKLPRNTKKTFAFRYPEQVHTDLYLKQYAIQAIDGGMMEPLHFEAVTKIVNENLKPKQFAIWRVEPPFYTRTKKPKGQKRGGGKGKIHHFLTPVRANRIIVEVAGEIIYEEAFAMLAHCAKLMPFRARFISQEELDEEAACDEEIAQLNKNEISWEMFCRFNMANCTKYMSPYDHLFRGKFW